MARCIRLSGRHSVRLRRTTSALRRAEGQSLIEFAILMPILLVLFLGIVEAATAYDRQHTLEGLSREGANIASRGAELDEVVDLMVESGSIIGLEDRGGAIVSRLRVGDGLAEIVGQEATTGYLGQSQLGTLGEFAADFDGYGMVEGSNLHVVELFYSYDPFTPLGSFVVGAIPQGLYSRAVF